MLDFLVTIIARFILWLRYDIKLFGLDAVAAKGERGIVFLPNHPALIDPVILSALLRRRFTPHGFGDLDQVSRPFIHFFAKRWGVRTIPSIEKYGPAARAQIEKALDETIEGLKRGENLLLWPAGRIYRSWREELGANSAVERIIENCPGIRIVLVRTTGLWGSAFGWAGGCEPNVARVLGRGLLYLLASGIFFAPRRGVKIEFDEPADLPRNADRNTFNRFLEEFYNATAQPNTYVPYTIWEKGGPRIKPEPTAAKFEGNYSAIPESTRRIVLEHLLQSTGIRELKDGDYLAADLGMDSLARTDLLLWLEKEFGFQQADADAMHTVGDVMLAACGQFVYISPTTLKPVPARWFKHAEKQRAALPPGDTITEIFLRQAARLPGRPAITDQAAGVKSYHDVIVSCLLLKPVIQQLPGDYLGIMLPASSAADIFYLAALFAGRTPVMVNWTAGIRNITSSLDSVGVRHIITSKLLVERLTLQGIDFTALRDRFVFAEDIRTRIPFAAKLKAAVLSRLCWVSLRKAKPPQTAVILFTSGSETVPKAVPLTHANLIANMQDVLSVVKLYECDRLIGFLPPFHSFGLNVTMLLPLCAGAQVVHHPNPTEADTLAKLIDAYKVTLLAGTPTFVGGILRVATANQLSSVRLAVTGAEKCPQRLYESLKGKCPQATILEGYGVTECSPIISLNDESAPQPFTIGKVLPALEYLIADPDTFSALPVPATGILLVRGPSVFSGYLNYSGKSPFVNVDGKQWYSTGDLVGVDGRGVLTFKGRLKRFVKLGGEMVSLPAIESILESQFAEETEKGPVLAVDATETEPPELVLFTTLDLDRETANRRIREAGLSGLHSIRRVVKLKEMPLLGTGKTNYRALKQLLAETV